jgi:hypothetical protein
MPPKKSRSKKNLLKINPNSNNAIPGFPGFGPAPPPVHTSNVSFFKNPLLYIHEHISYLNSSKFFAGVVMILLNVGSKFISIQFSKSTEEYLKFSLSKQLLVFAMAWMGTRDIYTALGLTAIFVVLSEHLFNEDSHYCIVPQNFRVLHKLTDANGDGVVTEGEISSAITVLEKAKREKQMRAQMDAYDKFKSVDNELPQLNNNSNSSNKNT